MCYKFYPQLPYSSQLAQESYMYPVTQHETEHDALLMREASLNPLRSNSSNYFLFPMTRSLSAPETWFAHDLSSDFSGPLSLNKRPTFLDIIKRLQEVRLNPVSKQRIEYMGQRPGQEANTQPFTSVVFQDANSQHGNVKFLESGIELLKGLIERGLSFTCSTDIKKIAQSWCSSLVEDPV
ncbi:hypothetical protein P691DRAFT_788262 [Macrolepiota fuliginosa MF-IS2]|uniref:Uncharacterized protein n=1 Tax=Macrolepiota fuliginosa MF-IS2 TaxID=1400762 RepID=A0A9P5X2P9_9AGAR|nr:hypothetical protein P691DRAFT_788262 [Macrolepiota fuliginosa MF-IS2]